MFIANFMGSHVPVAKTGLVNHRGGIGELGEQIVNHSVIQPGTIGETLVNHALDDAAPTPDHFIKKITEEELAKTLGLKPYAGRALSLTCAQDIVQLPEELKCGWEYICAHFDFVGLERRYSQNVYWDNDFDFANQPRCRDLSLDPFYYGEEAHRVRPNAARFFATEQMNDKGHFLRLTRSVGVEIPHTLFFETKEMLGSCAKIQFPIVLKINRSVAGLGTKVCRDQNTLEQCLANMRSGVGFHLQEYLGTDAQFVSAQYALNGGMARYVTSSCNFISRETEHEGNWGGGVFSQNFPQDLNTVGMPIAATIAKIGGEGWLGIDIGINADGKMFPVEANLRYTAAAYYFMTACKLKMHDQLWAGRSYASSKSLSELDLEQIAFTEKRGYGWVLTNWGPMVCGKVGDDGKMKYGGGFLYLGPQDFRLYKESEDKLRAFLA